MTEWIVILCLVSNPLTGFAKGVIGDKIWHIYMSSSTQTFSEQWQSLTKEERLNSTIIKGVKAIVPNQLLEENGQLHENDVRCLIGYCGLNKGHYGGHQLHKNENGHECNVRW